MSDKNKLTFGFAIPLLAASIVATQPFAAGQMRSAPSTPTTRPLSGSPSSGARPSFRENYSMLYEHNIFVRERARAWRDQNSQGGSGSATQRAPEQSFVLTGIVLEGGERRAYLEDRAHGGMVRLSMGDPIARGRIADIDINSVTYEQAGREQWIAIGSDLTGAAPVLPSYGASSPATNPTTLPFDPNSPNLTTEQKMMLNRFKELNKK
jgi:hypothetical protein